MLRASVISVIDTRSRDEHGFIIHGSGDSRRCDICQREIYIHAIMSDGRVIGRECAKKVTGKQCTMVARQRFTITIRPNGENGRPRFTATFSNGKVESWFAPPGGNIGDVVEVLKKQWPCDEVIIGN